VERNGVTVNDTTDYAYRDDGVLDTITLPNGVVTDYVYDSLGRIDTLTHYAPEDGTGDPDSFLDNAVLAAFDYTVRADGKRTAVTEQFDTDDDGVLDLAHTFTWDYDNLGRLITETLDSSDNSLDYTHDYAFDLVGNRLELLKDAASDGTTDETVSYTYDDNDRLLTETKDVAGSTTDDRHTVYGYNQTEQTSKTVHAGLDDTGPVVESTTSTYNLQGRLDAVEIDADGDGTTDTTTSYLYNDAGIRVEQTVNGATSSYLNDPQNPTGYSQVLEEHTGGANPDKTYTLALDVVAQTDTSGTVHFLLTDAQGSTRAIINAGAVLLEAYAYDAYGNALGFDPSAALTTFLYSGEQWDAAIGQQYLRARYYSPQAGRFNRLDPFFGHTHRPQSLHKYAYAHGDPVFHADPSGLLSIPQFLSVASISSYLGSVAADYAIGKGIEAATLLAIEGNLRNFRFLTAWDALSLIPGSAYTRSARVVAHAGAAGLRATGSLLVKTGARRAVGKLAVKRGAKYVDEAVNWFTNSVAKNAEGIWKLRSASGDTIRVTSSGRNGFQHYIERHLPQYYDGSRAGGTSLFPAGTTPSHLVDYIEETIRNISTPIGSQIEDTFELSNGIIVRYVIDQTGRLKQFFPEDGQGVTNALEVIRHM